RSSDLLGQGNRIDTMAGSLIGLAACIMISLCAAEYMRTARHDRFRTRNELIVADTLLPFGLFTLNTDQQFEHINAAMRTSLGLTDEQDYPGLLWIDFFPAQDWQQVAHDTEQGTETSIRMLEHLTQPGPPRS